MRYFRLIVLSVFFLSFSAKAQDLITFQNFEELNAYIQNNSEKPLVVNFWATWCAPCVKELPYFQKLHQENDKYIKSFENLILPKFLEESFLNSTNKKIGDTIILEAKDTLAGPNLKNKEIKIVGSIRSPLYISRERGSTKLASGKINYYIYVPQSEIISQIYTEIYVRVKDADKLVDNPHYRCAPKSKPSFATLTNKISSLYFAMLLSSSKILVFTPLYG